jgi:AraC-like DNA-binding protein
MDNSLLHINEQPKLQEGFKGQISCILPQKKRKFCSIHAFCKKLYITDIGYYPNATFHNRLRAQGISQYILIYCIKGEGWFSVEGVKKQVKANEYFILPKNKAHEYGSEIGNPWTIYWVHFDGESAEYLASYLQPAKKKPPFFVAPSSLRLMIFDDIISHLELSNNSDNLIYASSSLYAFLTSFHRLNIKITNKEFNPIEELINYMKNNLDKNLTLKQFAEHVSMSPSHLSAIFKRKTKYSPVNLFTNLKIQKASQLLLDEQHSIKTIALTLGFDDPYHFSRIFKRVMGVAPKYFKSES